MDENLKICRDNSQIPVVDLSYLDNINNSWDNLKEVKINQLAQNFGQALRDSGLIFIQNHGIAQELVSTQTKDVHNVWANNVLIYERVLMLIFI